MEKIKNLRDRTLKFFGELKHPLSSQGRDFFNEFKKMTDSDLERHINLIPSVKNPHTEYFLDILNSGNLNYERITSTINCISLADGCSHSCTFCALESPKKIRRMEYPTILKISESISKNTHFFGQTLNNVLRNLENNSLDIPELNNFMQLNANRALLQYGNLNYTPLQDFEMRNIRELDAPEKEKLKLWLNKQKPRLINYFRCDPFDYRFSFPDGSIANYGDVYQLFSNAGFAVDIATACWDKGDKIAQEAGDKISRLGVTFPSNIFVSYHGYSTQARSNFEKYLNSVINVILTINRNPLNRLEIRCEDKEQQAERLFKKLNSEGILKECSITDRQVNAFFANDEDIESKRLVIRKKYREILSKDQLGKLKLMGNHMGHSVDFDGGVYLRENILEDYKFVGSIFNG